jgi:hypothetical protein
VVVEVGAVAGVCGAGEALSGDGHVVLGPLAEGDLAGIVVDVDAAVDVGLGVADVLLRVAFAFEGERALPAGGVVPAGAVLAVRELLGEPHGHTPAVRGRHDPIPAMSPENGVKME